MIMLWTVVVTTFLLACGPLIAIRASFSPGSDVGRWLQNNLTFSVFLLIPFPIAAGVLAETIRSGPLAKVPRHILVPLLAILGLFLAAGALLVHQDALMSDRAIEPYNFRASASPLEMERKARQQARVALSGQAADHATALRARADYISGVPSFPDLRTRFQLGSSAANWILILNLAGAVIVATYLWYIVALVAAKFIANVRFSAVTHDRLVLIFGLLITWVPLRGYTEWYINFYTLDHLPHYAAFGVLCAVAAAAAVGLVLLQVESRGVKIFTAITSGLAAVVTFVGKFKPEILRPVAKTIEGLNFESFIVAWIVVAAIFGMVLMAWYAVVAGEGSGTPGADRGDAAANAS